MDPRVEAFREAEERYLESLRLDGEEHFVPLPGIGLRTRYREIGDGPPVLMVHGGGGTAVEWAGLAAHTHGFRLILPDRPGFGLTEPVDYRRVDLRAHAVDFLVGLLDAVKVGKTSIIANSMGALWSLWLALARPERVHRLVLIGTPALVLGTSAPAGMRLLGVPGLNRLMMALERPSPAQARRLLGRLGHDPDRCSPEMIDVMQHLERLPWYADAWLSLLQNVLPLGRVNRSVTLGEEELGRLRQDVLYLWGAKDPFGSVEVAERARAVTPGARLEVVGDGHLPWIDEPERCGALSSEFLRSAP